MVTKRRAERRAKRVARRLARKVKSGKVVLLRKKAPTPQAAIRSKPKVKVIPKPKLKQPLKYSRSSSGGTKFKVQKRQSTKVQNVPRVQNVHKLAVIRNQTRQLTPLAGMQAMIRARNLQQQKRPATRVGRGNNKQLMAVDVNGKMQDVYVYSQDGKYTGYERRDDPYSFDYSPRFIEQRRVGKTPREVFEMRKKYNLQLMQRR